ASFGGAVRDSDARAVSAKWRHVRRTAVATRYLAKPAHRFPISVARLGDRESRPSPAARSVWHAFCKHDLRRAISSNISEESETKMKITKKSIEAVMLASLLGF